MDEKEQEPPHPTSPANGQARRDAEAGTAAASCGGMLYPKLKRTRCLVYLLLFLLFHAAIVLILTLTVLRVRTPKFRLISATVNEFNAGTAANPSFDARMKAELSVKNSNFGRYKYRNGTVSFYYRDIQVGEAHVRSSRANWRSTKKFEIGLDLSFANGQAVSQLSSDLSAGIVPLTCRSRLKGRVEIAFFTKKSRSTEMNCSMEIVTANRQLRNIVCN